MPPPLYTLLCCKSSPLFSFLKQCTKATQGRKLCCNILKHKSCKPPVQRQHPVFLTHGSDSVEAAPICLVSCFSKWLLYATWSPAFTHPNIGCASKDRCVCVQLLNRHVPLHAGIPLLLPRIHFFPHLDI